MGKLSWKKITRATTAVIGTGFVVATTVAKRRKPDSTYENDPEQKNPFEGKKVVFVEDDCEAENADGVRGHLEEAGEPDFKENMYSKYVKRGFDIVLSFGGLIVLSPVLAGIAIAIKIDDPGPVLFTQKRLGKNKQYFKLHKFRSMKMSTPRDVPTHQLADPDYYITKVGKFLRAHSLDELPQIWDIFIGNMSVIGPRPGLWNQDLLTAERDRYGANDIKPGLTGWAQINGRDELEIPVKARLDGEYKENLGLKMDIKCFMKSLHVFGKDESVVEGGTGEIHKKLRPGVPEENPQSIFGCDKEITIPHDGIEKKVLVTGAGSYIGESFIAYAAEHYPNIQVDTVDMIGDNWRSTAFSEYDSVYHVAGIAHADVGNVDDATKEKYYKVNTDLAIETARKAMNEGVKQFIFMSSMIIYGESASYGRVKMITRETLPIPANFYGDSKWQADKGVRALESEEFHVAVLRPPMIYGRGSKGNYPTLAKLAKKIPVFPNVDNQRSMLHIDNLCEFLCRLMMSGEGGIFFPQNIEYIRTTEMVKEIGEVTGNRVITTRLLNPAVRIAAHVPGKVSGLTNKAFGNSCYDQRLSKYSFDYVVHDFKESIEVTEGEKKDHMKTIWIIDHYSSEPKYGGIQRQFDFANELSRRGYRTVIISSAFSHFTHTYITEEPCLIAQFAENAYYAYIHTESYETNGGMGRVKNMLSFQNAVGKYCDQIAEKLGKPDIVEGASVHPLAWIAAYKIAKKYGVRFIAEVRDLWPEMWLLNGEKGKLDPMVLFFGTIEKWAFKRADKIIYSMLYGDQYICGKLGFPQDKVALLGQPMDCERFDNNAIEKQDKVPKEIRGFIKNSFTCVFTGYFMEYEGVHVMLKAAKILHNKGLPIKFLFIGSGKEEDAMKEYVEKNDLDNVFIHGRISKELIPAILRSCDICLAHCATEGKEESFKYGISKNKVNEYLYSGNPVIYGRDDEMDPVAKYGAGYVVKPFKPEQFVERITEIYNMTPEQRAKFGENGKDYIIKYHRVDSLVDNLLRVFNV